MATKVADGVSMFAGNCCVDSSPIVEEEVLADDFSREEPLPSRFLSPQFATFAVFISFCCCSVGPSAVFTLLLATPLIMEDNLLPCRAVCRLCEEETFGQFMELAV